MTTYQALTTQLQSQPHTRLIIRETDFIGEAVGCSMAGRLQMHEKAPFKRPSPVEITHIIRAEWMLRFFSHVFISIFILSYSGLSTAALTLVDKGASKYCIYYAVNAPKSVHLAASELQNYLAKATGVTLKIVRNAKDSSCSIISLGSNPASKNAGVDVSTIQLEGYRITTHEKNLFILGIDTPDREKTKDGGTSTGTLFGVYTFLEDFLGVKWLMPGEIGELVPKRNTFFIPIINRVDNPIFVNRRLPYVQNGHPLVEEWLRRQKQGYTVQLNHGHSYEQTLPASLYDKHPEWFAMINGSRLPPRARYKLETTNPAMISAFAERVISELKKDPSLYSVSLSPSDGDNWSESPQSQAYYEHDPQGHVSRTKLVLDFYNNVAREVGKVFPERQLCGYIYASYLYPPSGGIPRLEPNVCLVLAPNFSYGYGLYRDNAKQNLERLLDAWGATKQLKSYYDLPVTFEQNIGAPNPPGLEILKFLYPTLASKGIKGIYIYGVAGWGQGALTNYLLAKLNWNPYANVDALVIEFLSAAYGVPAGKVMGDMYSMLDRSTKNYYLTHPEANYNLSFKVIAGIYGPILPRIEAMYLSAVKQTMSPEQRIRLLMFRENMFNFYQYLSDADVFQPQKTSPFIGPSREFGPQSARADLSLATAKRAKENKDELRSRALREKIRSLFN